MLKIKIDRSEMIWKGKDMPIRKLIGLEIK